jgi:arylsulfatase A-like enzyme
MQGRSLVPLLDGKAPTNWRTDFWIEHLMDHKQIIKHEGVRNDRFKYARYFERNPLYEELYDLQNDPLEAVNLGADPAFADVLMELRARTDELRDAYGGPYVRDTTATSAMDP